MLSPNPGLYHLSPGSLHYAPGLSTSTLPSGQLEWSLKKKNNKSDYTIPMFNTTPRLPTAKSEIPTSDYGLQVLHHLENSGFSDALSLQLPYIFWVPDPWSSLCLQNSYMLLISAPLALLVHVLGMLFPWVFSTLHLLILMYKLRGDLFNPRGKAVIYFILFLALISASNYLFHFCVCINTYKCRNIYIFPPPPPLEFSLWIVIPPGT